MHTGLPVCTNLMYKAVTAAEARSPDVSGVLTYAHSQADPL